MSDWVIEPPARPWAEVAGGGRFPLRRVFCVGRNYLEHVREMGNDEREPPFFFTKPADAVVPSGTSVRYPPDTADLHHEIELAVAVGRGGRDIAEGEAAAHLWGAGVAIDLTRRDRQAEAKKAGRPWDMAKGFDASAPLAPLQPLRDVSRGRIWLAVNGEVRQDADLADMIWSVPEIVAHLSRTVELAPGDLILTGTPAGVSALRPGDRVTGGAGDLPEIEISITD